MKIKSLRLRNFKSFEDETYFDFETDKDKNIILIGGENGSGKSSLFEAMKLCIYGPLAYNYQGIVSNYIARIKSYMNNNIFKNKDVTTFIEMEIYLTINGEEDIYKLKREWRFENNKLKESFSVVLNEKLLTEEQLEYFESYIKNIIPPSIFQLLFFDGEMLFEFFIGRNSDIRLKETLLQLCNYDIFSILQNELIRNRKNRYKNDERVREYISNLDEVEKKLNHFYEVYESVELKLNKEKEKVENLKLKYKNLYKEFKRSGGMFFKEREKLITRLGYLESMRADINQRIKEYCNETLPFIMVKDILKDIKNQLYLEEEYLAFKKINEKLQAHKLTDIFKEVLGNKLLEEIQINLIVDKITEQIFPKSLHKEFKPLHFVSREQHNNIVSFIDKILNENIDEVNYFKDISKINGEIADIRNKLNNSLSNSDEKHYIKQLEELNRLIYNGEIEIEKMNMEKKQIEEEIIILEKEKGKINNQLILCKQSNNIKTMLDNIIDMLDDLIASVTKNKVKQLEKHFENIFKSIIRKDKFIDYMKIEDDFSVSLYLKKNFTVHELIQMIINIGLEGVEKKYSKKFVDSLFSIYGTKDKLRLLELMNREDYRKIYSLDSKVNILDLSSGEKQIYVLCLYWALIKTSEVKLPFVIDTPYGRIDEKHRQAITTKYLPNISEQVIIFSTNTEINEELYSKLKPYVSKEYMLKYDTKTMKTKVNRGYFYEVDYGL